MTVNTDSMESVLKSLPALDCGLCGSRTCEDFARIVAASPAELRKCIHLQQDSPAAPTFSRVPARACAQSCAGCDKGDVTEGLTWHDSLQREFDFVLDTFPNEPGPRETMRLHNPQLTKELEVKRGDIIIGRPLGMSCGCPITHCGVVMNVEARTGVIVWCVTGPLNPRAGEHKDIGYYSAEAYEGMVRDTQKELKIGMRYWFMPRRCMLQWRHSGLINFISRTKNGTQVRIEGLYIG